MKQLSIKNAIMLACNADKRVIEGQRKVDKIRIIIYQRLFEKRKKFTGEICDVKKTDA